MLFTSIEFLLFLFVSVMIYYLLPGKMQWLFLLGASLFFYVSIAHKLVVFILFAGLCTWIAGCVLDRMKAKEKAIQVKAKAEGADRATRNHIKSVWKSRRRLVIAFFLLSLLGMLAFFKFYNMFAVMLQPTIQLPLWKRAMPLGISFYTLQLISYVMDIHSGKIHAETNPLKLTLFTCWFPQVIQGPIGRWDALSESLFSPKKFNYDLFVMGWMRMVWGYFKKLVIADRFVILVNTVFDHHTEYAGFVVMAAAFFYVVQLYCDFSGGIDIALGAAQMFGVTMAENFNFPFSSKSISEFWRRWHITLGTFLRDYVFYPLTLSKPFAKLGKWLAKHVNHNAGKLWPGYLAMFILWFCSGVWHGEGWHYVVYGLYHGTLIVMGMCVEGKAAAFFTKKNIDQNNKLLTNLRIFRTCLLVGIGEIIFRAETTRTALEMMKSIFSVWNPQVLFDGTMLKLGLDMPDMIVGLIAIVVLFFVNHVAKRLGGLRERIYHLKTPARWAILLAGVLVISVFGIYGPSYDPTPFVYFQF